MLYFEKINKNNRADRNYTVTFSEYEETVSDFCDAVLSRSIQLLEQGRIYISKSQDLWHAAICQYNYSVMEFENAYSDYKDRKIISAKANSGFGTTDYFLTVS